MTLLSLAGCGSEGLQPSGGGLAQGDAARLSGVVAQTRAQFPALSAPDVPYRARVSPSGAEPAPVLVLRGEGAGVQPGLQVGERVKMLVSLYLAKPGYDRGFAKLAENGQPEETWRVLAYEKRGAPGEAFEFSYALAAPGKEVRYLMVIGGRFKEGKTVYAGMEGTLVLPGPDARIEGWKRAYKIDFGRRFPVVPGYQGLVVEADDLFGRLKRDVPGLESLAGRVANAEAALAGQGESGGGSEAEQAARAARRAEEEARLAKQKARLAAERERLERDALRYFELRELIAGAYAAFTESNQYTWALPAAQQAFFDHWKTVEFHHPKIDELAEKLAALLTDPNPLKAARSKAMEAVKRNDNWNRNPSGTSGGKRKRSG